MNTKINSHKHATFSYDLDGETTLIEIGAEKLNAISGAIWKFPIINIKLVLGEDIIVDVCCN